jgi:hypothetical protein
MLVLGFVSRASPAHAAMRNCTRAGGGPFGFRNQVPISSHRELLSPKAMVANVAEKRRDKIPSGTVERGECKRTVAEVSKGD